MSIEASDVSRIILNFEFSKADVCCIRKISRKEPANGDFESIEQILY